MVVAAHPLAARAGLVVLKKGGNAFDAAVATSLMLGVVEPAFSGMGGGGFALVFRSTGESLALDYRETAPLGSSALMFADGSDKNRVGPMAIATPGLLAGQAKLLEKYGTTEFADLAKPAVEAAKHGLHSESLSLKMLSDKESVPFKKISRFETSSKVFLGKRRFPLLARTLSTLASRGPGEFYHGPIPKKVTQYLRDLGGVLSEEDFGSYAPKDRRPVMGDYMGTPRFRCRRRAQGDITGPRSPGYRRVEPRASRTGRDFEAPLLCGRGRVPVERKVEVR
jgi:gamma-glutamyltranspeptidase/glutathione hydrolase